MHPADEQIDNQFLVSSSDLHYNPFNNVETIKINSGGKNQGGKKGKKATVVCETNLNEDQMNEYVQLDKEDIPKASVPVIKAKKA